MDFALSDEQQQVRELARSILGGAQDREPAPAWHDAELWTELAKAQLTAVTVPVEQGGAELGVFELALVLEEAGRSLAPVPLLGHALATLAISRFGSTAQRERWLRPVVERGTWLAAALLEAGPGEAARPATRASRNGRGFTLEGTKACVPAADGAAGLLVAARGPEGAGLFLVEPAQSGVRLLPQRLTHGEPCFQVVLEGVRVDEEAAWGPPVGGAELLPWLLRHAALGVSAYQLGIAEEALERTAAYVSERKQFGRAIGSFQGVALRIADAAIDVQAMRATLVQAAWRLDAGVPADAEVSAARWWAARGGHRVVHAAQHLHGGIGADVAYPIHRYFLAAKQAELLYGGPAQEAQQLGATLLERSRRAG